MTINAMTHDNLESFFTIRVSNRLKTEFLNRAGKYGIPSDVLREIMQALVDGRLVIKPDEKRESLYVNRSNP